MFRANIHGSTMTGDNLTENTSGTAAGLTGGNEGGSPILLPVLAIVLAHMRQDKHIAWAWHWIAEIVWIFQSWHFLNLSL